MSADRKTSGLRRFLELAAKWVSALLPLKKWRRGFRVRANWRLELCFEGRHWDRLKNKLFSTNNKSVLVVGQDLTVTGAPMVLFMEIKALLKNGAAVMAAAAAGGGLEAELDKLGVESLVSSALRDYGPSIERLARGFDLVVINSLSCGAWLNILPPDTPVLWYVHEGLDIPRDIKARPELGQALRRCRHLYIVSEHAASFLPEGVRAEVLHLGVPDQAGALSTKAVGPKIRVAVIGTFFERKGQHLMLKALSGLDEQRRSQLEIHLIGDRQYGEYFESLKDQCRPGWPVFFEGEISDQNSKWEIYNSFDVFCVPSLDETCSLVLLEACMLQKPFIISDQVGGRYLLREGNGLSFPAGNAPRLRQALEWCLEHKEELVEMGRRARQAYEQGGSGERFEMGFMAAVDSIPRPEDR